MTIRPAIISDARAICSLVNHYAEQDLMLHRSLESVYDCLREFIVAVDDNAAQQKLLGCAAVDILWSDCAEMRSLAVADFAKGLGVGKELVAESITEARRLGISKLFAMTYEKEFFQRLGFSQVDIKDLPEKVWRECLTWYSQGHRHETAMLIHVDEVK